MRPMPVPILRAKPIPTKAIVNNQKVTDHHAIIPTEEPADLSALSPEERNVYDLVVRRFLAVLSSPCGYEEVDLALTIGKHTFYAKGKTVTNPGWQTVYGAQAALEEPEAEEETESQSFPVLTQGAKLAVRQVCLSPGQTKPPARYTEATLLTAMEHPGGQVQDQKAAPYAGGDKRPRHACHAGGHHREAVRRLFASSGRARKSAPPPRGGSSSGSSRPI